MITSGLSDGVIGITTTTAMPAYDQYRRRLGLFQRSHFDLEA